MLLEHCTCIFNGLSNKNRLPIAEKLRPAKVSPLHLRGPHRLEKPSLRLVRSGCKGTNFSEDMVVVIIFICTFVPKFTNEGYGSEENTEISAPGDG